MNACVSHELISECGSSHHDLKNQKKCVIDLHPVAAVIVPSFSNSVTTRCCNAQKHPFPTYTSLLPLPISTLIVRTGADRSINRNEFLILKTLTCFNFFLDCVVTERGVRVLCEGRGGKRRVFFSRHFSSPIPIFVVRQLSRILQSH